MEERLAYSVEEACRAARSGKSKLYEAIRDGKLIARKHGRKTIILAEDLRSWINSFPAITPKHKRGESAEGASSDKDRAGVGSDSSREPKLSGYRGCA